MQILIRPTCAEVAVEAADAIAPAVSPGAVLGLATGSTPSATYAELAKRHRTGAISFSGCTAFLLDEYCGLGQDDEQSYYQTIRREFTSFVDFADDKIHSLPGTGVEPAEACAAFEEAIEYHGGIDVQILGIGTNGHIAFNEPASSLRSRTRRVRLSPQTIEDNSRFFDSLDQVPRYALTQGLGTIMEARHIVLIATGAAKASAVRGLVEGPVSAALPASVLQMHNQTTLILDEAAASALDHANFYKSTDDYWCQ